MSFSLLQFQSFIWTDRASFLCKIIFLPISLCNAPCIKRARQLAIDPPPPDQSRLCWDSREINYEYIGYRPSSKLVYGPMFLLIFIWQRVLIAFLSDEAYRSLFPRLSLFLPFFSSYFCSFLYIISVVLNPNVFLTGHLIGHSICLLLKTHYPAKVFPEYSLEYWPEDFLCSF